MNKSQQQRTPVRPPVSKDLLTQSLFIICSVNNAMKAPLRELPSLPKSLTSLNFWFLLLLMTCGLGSDLDQQLLPPLSHLVPVTTCEIGRLNVTIPESLSPEALVVESEVPRHISSEETKPGLELRARESQFQIFKGAKGPRLTGHFSALPISASRHDAKPSVYQER